MKSSHQGAFGSQLGSHIQINYFHAMICNDIHTFWWINSTQDFPMLSSRWGPKKVVFVAIAFFNFTTPEVDEKSVQEALRWRRPPSCGEVRVCLQWIWKMYGECMEHISNLYLLENI